MFDFFDDPYWVKTTSVKRRSVVVMAAFQTVAKLRLKFKKLTMCCILINLHLATLCVQLIYDSYKNWKKSDYTRSRNGRTDDVGINLMLASILKRSQLDKANSYQRQLYIKNCVLV